MTFMNLSGGPVAGLAQFYQVPIEQIIAIHDELDVPWTQLRLKIGGGKPDVDVPTAAGNVNDRGITRRRRLLRNRRRCSHRVWRRHQRRREAAAAAPMLPALDHGP